MDVLIWVLGLLSLILAVVVSWLGWARSQATRQHHDSESESTRRLIESESESKRHQAASETLRLERDDAIARGADERAKADARTEVVTALSVEKAELAERLSEAGRKIEEHGRLEERFTDALKAMTADALQANRKEFIAQAKPVFDAAQRQQAELIKPIGETLTQTKAKLEAIDKARVETQARLTEQIQSMLGAGAEVRAETARLTKALSRPEIRGQYGEIQLRRVAELAGMRSYCDFSEQDSQRDDDGHLQRPDMVVKLPNDRVIAVDAKTNTYAYIEAVNAETEAERERHLDRFARHVSEQAKKLGDKKYWSNYDHSPDFIIMFVPGDHFIDAALSRRPDLIETAAVNHVILASPSTLIGLLRAVAIGWQEHRLAEDAEALFKLGRELHERAGVAFAKIDELGGLLGRTTKKYNELVGSVDGRLVPTLKKFEQAGAKGAGEIKELKPVDAQPRQLVAGSASGEAATQPRLPEPEQS